MKEFMKISKWLVISLALVSQLSCGNKGSGSSEDSGIPYYDHGIGGYTLPGGEAILAQAVSEGPMDLPMTLSWSIYGQAPLVQQLQWTTTSPAKTYQGLVNARGTLRIPFNYPMMGCMIPAGTYTVASTAQGRWSAGIFQFPTLIAQNGATTLTMSMSGVVIDPNGDSQVDRLSGGLQILRVMNGAVQNCFVSSFSMF